MKPSTLLLGIGLLGLGLFPSTLCFAQDSPDTADAGAKGSAVARVALESLPRDEKGFLKQEVWDIVKQEAAAKPVSNEASLLKARPQMQAYYATFAQWKAPDPAPVPEGKLRNLADAPTTPRFPLTDKVWPEKAGDASICLWEDDKLAAMSLGVDDNNAGDLPYWKELSKKYGGLNITWNLITFNIDGVVDKGRISAAGTWDMWKEMLNEGYHLASHSMTHNHDPVFADGWPGPDWEAAESQRICPGIKPRSSFTRAQAFMFSASLAATRPRATGGQASSSIMRRRAVVAASRSTRRT